MKGVNKMQDEVRDCGCGCNNNGGLFGGLFGGNGCGCCDNSILFFILIFLLLFCGGCGCNR